MRCSAPGWTAVQGHGHASGHDVIWRRQISLSLLAQDQILRGADSLLSLDPPDGPESHKMPLRFGNLVDHKAAETVQVTAEMTGKLSCCTGAH